MKRPATHAQTADEGPELIVGFVAPVGTDLRLLAEKLTSALDAVNYRTEFIRVSSLIQKACDKLEISVPPTKGHHNRLMTLGNELRKRFDDGGAAAMLAVTAIRDIRQNLAPEHDGTLSRVAFVLRSLKHEQEVKTLREVYGSRFVLVAATAPLSERVDSLAREYAQDSLGRDKSFTPRATAEQLVARDDAEAGEPLGQHVREVFPLADLFVDASRRASQRGRSIDKAITRGIELLFGHPYRTPNRDELAMFHAHAASLRSSALSRQVGAVVTTTDGELVASGANEVPRPGGGQYWPDDPVDARDFTLGHELSDKLKRRLLADVLSRLKKAAWFDDRHAVMDIDELVTEAAHPEHGPARDAELFGLVEFGRVVHAEMAAVVSAARRGTSVDGCTLYTTTFPCHNCGRHIIAAGIKRVVYIEPYPKSRLWQLHDDAVTTEGSDPEGRVLLEPYVGVAPSLFLQLFAAGRTERLGPEGRLRDWRASEAVPRLADEDVAADRQIFDREIELRNRVSLVINGE